MTYCNTQIVNSCLCMKNHTSTEQRTNAKHLYHRNRQTVTQKLHINYYTWSFLHKTPQTRFSFIYCLYQRSHTKKSAYQQLFTVTLIVLNRALAGLWKSLNFFPDFQGLESPWKQTWSLKVLKSVSEGPWKCLNLIFQSAVTEKGVPDGFFLTSNVHKMYFCQGFAPDPAGGAYNAYICL